MSNPIRFLRVKTIEILPFLWAVWLRIKLIIRIPQLVWIALNIKYKCVIILAALAQLFEFICTHCTVLACMNMQSYFMQSSISLLLARLIDCIPSNCTTRWSNICLGVCPYIRLTLSVFLPAWKTCILWKPLLYVCSGALLSFLLILISHSPTVFRGSRRCSLCHLLHF